MVPAADEVVLLTAPHEVDDVACGNQPFELLGTGIGHRKPPEPFPDHSFDRTDNTHRRGHGADVLRPQ